MNPMSTNVEQMIDVTRDEWLPRTDQENDNLGRITRQPETRTHLEVHHGGAALGERDPFEAWEDYYDYHTGTKGWQDIWYNLGILPDGRLVELRGAWAANSSRPFLTVNLPGHGDVDSTDVQFDTIHRLRLAMIADGAKAELTYHAARGGTACPGTLVINRIAQINAAERDTGLVVPPNDIDPEAYLDELPIHVAKSGAPLVGIFRTAGIDGYYVLAADGGVFTFGAVPFLGSVPGVVSHNWENDPFISMALDVRRGAITGYSLLTARGAVFNFGSARFHGRMDVIGD